MTHSLDPEAARARAAIVEGTRTAALRMVAIRVRAAIAQHEETERSAHGTPNTTPCRGQAASAQETVDASTLRWRMQSLEAMGWPLTVQAERAGVARQDLARILAGATSAPAAVSRAVRLMYSRLRHLPPPTGSDLPQRIVVRTRARALRQGWAPPRPTLKAAIHTTAAHPAATRSLPRAA